MKQFEYKIIEIGGEVNDLSYIPGKTEEDQLNKYGKEGWELVGVQDAFVIFKREIIPENKQIETVDFDKQSITAPTVKFYIPEIGSEDPYKLKEYKFDFVLKIPNRSIGNTLSDVNEYYRMVGGGRFNEFITECDKIAKKIFV